MIQFSLILASLMTLGNMTLYDFNKNSNLTNWTVVDDDVMGGRSNGHFNLSSDGYGVFHGEVSLENNGGFSSVRYQFSQRNISGRTKMIIRLKGDGIRYQFRVKSNKYDRHSYIYHFETTGNWQTVEIPLLEMKASFRGRELDIPLYQGAFMEEIAFFISNKKAEHFKLELDNIGLNKN
jgi:NADH dehydrogenase [ubiquinone] 1 alpha subcomplex assembly factor 1